MRKIERIEGKKVLLDTEEDEGLLYGNKLHVRRTGQYNATRWISLYAKKCKDGTTVYYLYHVSQWQGESCYIDMISKEEAERFAEENLDYFNDEEMETLEKYGIYPLQDAE